MDFLTHTTNLRLPIRYVCSYIAYCDGSFYYKLYVFTTKCSPNATARTLMHTQMSSEGGGGGRPVQ
eukprot:scaffold72943_cov42-Attheya_sp.AAC.3